MKQRSNARPIASTTVRRLAQMSILDTLAGAELAVYIRLIAATADHKTRLVQVVNVDLYAEPRTAARALRRLEDAGLIKVNYDGSKLGRTIEVYR